MLKKTVWCGLWSNNSKPEQGTTQTISPGFTGTHSTRHFFLVLNIWCCQGTAGTNNWFTTYFIGWSNLNLTFSKFLFKHWRPYNVWYIKFTNIVYNIHPWVQSSKTSSNNDNMHLFNVCCQTKNLICFDNKELKLWEFPSTSIHHQSGAFLLNSVCKIDEIFFLIPQGILKWESYLINY